MKINLKNGELLSMSKEFPMNVFEIQDVLDKLKIPDDKPIVEFSISEYDNMELPYTLCRRDFSADIYRLNLFAERLKNLDFSEMTAFKSLLIANPESSFEDMLMMTYGYESPDINIKIGRPENCFFRLLIVPEDEKIEQAQWVSLPCEAEITCDFYNGICLDFQSSLPNLKFDDAHKISTLNELAEQISQISHDDFVKLKAVMELEKINDISGTINCISRLSEYQFDRNIFDQSDFGRAYLLKNIHKNFDCSTFKDMNLYDFGQVILERKQGEITSYGAISGRGQELYSPLTIQAEQQLGEDLDEDFEPEMGGISL